MSKIHPFTPAEALRYNPQNRKVPPIFVIEALNELLSENYVNTSVQSITLTQDEIVKRIMEKGGIPDEYYDSVGGKYLDFLDTYRSAGWGVEPGLEEGPNWQCNVYVFTPIYKD